MEKMEESDIENEGAMYDRKDMESNGSLFSDRDNIVNNNTIREPLLRKRVNTTSQIAIVGAKVYPIESLDYE